MKLWQLALGIVLLDGCYHATVETGLAPSPQTIEKPWASSFVYGLVPPSIVETAAKCPSGVAKVETQLSFLNQLVGFLTLGIYTPMDIRVTCAAARSADGTATVRDPSPTRAVARAADLAAQSKGPVLVEFR